MEKANLAPILFFTVGIAGGFQTVPFCDPTTTLCRPEAIILADEEPVSVPRGPAPLPAPGSLIGFKAAHTASYNPGPSSFPFGLIRE
jgi:hypothetical protein